MARELLSARGLDSKLKEAQSRAAELNTRVRVSDGDNLNLVVRANGGASWVLDYRMGGSRKPLTLGTWPAVSLKTARELADVARGKVLRGVDPGAEAAPVAAATALPKAPVEHSSANTKNSPAGTVFRLMEAWIKIHSGSAVYKGNIRAAFTKDVLPVIGAMEPHLVHRADILKIMRSMEKRGALVLLRRLRMWMQHLYEFAIDSEEWPLVDASPVPAGQLRSFMAADAGHFAAVTNAAEVPALMRVIRAYPRTVIRTLLHLSAHVFQRPTEIREMVWEEVDLAEATWVIPAGRMKKTREHWVPLSTQMVELLRAHQGVVGTTGLVFPGRRYGQPFTGEAIEAAVHKLGFKGRHTPHGFRAMAHTVLAETLGEDERFIEKQLSHEDDNKVRKAYNRAEFWDQRVAMMQRWSDWLDAQV